MDSHPVTTSNERPKPEIAQVLFMDIVRFTALEPREQVEAYYELQDLVRNTVECRRRKKSDVVFRSSGDSMAVTFFRDPLAPIRCAIEISRNIRRQASIQLRTGIHSDLIFRSTDLTKQPDVIGNAINIAQRVASGGDPNHILLSEDMGKILISLGDWKKCISEIIQIQVKDRQLFVYNFFSGEFGNPTHPASRILVGKTKPVVQTVGPPPTDSETLGSRGTPPTQSNKLPRNRARDCLRCGMLLYPNCRSCEFCGALNE